MKSLFVAPCLLAICFFGNTVPCFSQTELKAHAAIVHSLALSKDGKLLASAGFDKEVKLFDVGEGKITDKKILTGHTAPVYSVAFTNDGTLLASSSLDKTVRLWEVATGMLKLELKGFTDAVDVVCFSPDQKIIATGAGNVEKSVRLWNVADGKEIKNLGAHGGSVYALAFTSDGKILASSGADNLIKLWDVPGQKLLKDLKGHELGVTGIAWLTDTTLISASQDRTIRQWDTTMGKEIKKSGPTPDDLFGISLDSSRKTVATIGYSGLVSQWDLAGAMPIMSHRIKSPGYAVVISPDGQWIYSGHDNGTIHATKRK
ncbi:MAG: WD40 repeat domain-containing protein [Zavarzinella sp.]